MRHVIRIIGRVVGAESSGAPGALRVEVRRVGRDAELGWGPVDERGRFEVPIRLAGPGRGLLYYFRVIGPAGVLLSTEGTVEWRAADPQRDIVLVLGSQQPGRGGGAALSVSGRVLQANGGPLSGVTVRAFDKMLRHEAQLGEARSDAQGSYTITYQPANVAHKTGRPDLVVRTYDTTGKQTAESPVSFRAPAQATVDVVVGGTTYVGFSEYEQVQQAVDPELDGATVAQLSTADVSFLAGDTDLEAAQVQAYSDANRLASSLGISVAAAYGLFRQGQAADPVALGALAPQTIRTVLTSAVAANVVPASVGTEIDTIVANLGKALVSNSLAAPAAGHVNLGTILQPSGAPQALQATALQVFADPTVAPADGWHKVRASAGANGAAAVARMQLALQLGTLTHNHGPLVTYLLGLSGSNQVNSLADLAKLGRADWYAMLSQSSAGQVIGAPADVPGASDQDRGWNYATTLYRAIEEAYPAAVLAGQLSKTSPSPATSDLARFVSQSPDFDLVRTNVDAYLKANPSSTAGVSDVKGLTASVKQWQRLGRVTPRVDEMQALAAAGLTSAQSVARMGQGAFANSFTGAFGAQRANTVFGNALHIANATFALYTKFNPAFNFPWVPSLGYLDPQSLSNQFQQAGLPDYATFFGSLDSCICEDCRSITSPAAYLVDLFQFMGPVAQPVLRSRRPDLFGTYLSCANTNTAMPYIDLVNEVLEFAVTNPPVAGLPQTPPPGTVWPQTTETADVLAAQPEHTNDAAYGVLETAVYPWTLPFSLGIEEARVYLKFLGVDVASLMETLQSQAGPSAVDVARVRLDMTPTEWALITTASTAAPAPVRAASADPSKPIPRTGTPGELGISLQVGDRVLIADQPLAATGSTNPLAVANGVYVVQTGAWTRAADAATTLPSWWLVPVTDGAWKGSVFALVSPGSATIGSTQLEFRPFSGTSVATLLQQTGLAYSDLLDLLATAYINPFGSPPSIAVQLDPNTCDLTTASVTGFGPTILDRFHRFTRLRNRLGWTPYQLDAGLRALTASDFTPQVLQWLADAKAVQGALSTDAVDMLSWWAPLIETTTYRDNTPSLYDSTFRNPTLDSATITIFDLDATRRELKTTSELWANHIPSLCAALGVSSSDLTTAAQGLAAVFPSPQLPDVAPNGALKLGTITVFYRAVSLARALGLTMTQLQLLRALTAINPFASPADTRAFIRARDAIHASPFSLEELAQLLLGAVVTPSAPLPTQDTAVALLTDVQTGLLKIAAQYAPTTDSTGDKLRAALTAALPTDAATQSAIDGLMAVVAGTSTLAQADQQALLHTYLDPVLTASIVTGIIQSLWPSVQPPTPPPMSTRYGAVLTPTLAVLRASLSQALVTQKMAAAFQLSVGGMRIVLTQGIRSAAKNAPPTRMAMDEFVDPGFVNGGTPVDSNPGGSPNPAYDVFENVLYPTLTLVAKAALIVGRLKLSINELTFTRPGASSPMFVGGDAAIGWPSLNTLPATPTPPAPGTFAGWQNEVSAFAFRDRFAVPGSGVFQLLAQATTSTLTAYDATLAALTGWSSDDLTALTGSSGLPLTFPRDYASGAALAALSTAEDLASRLGVNASKVLQWALAPASNAADIKSAAKSKYDQAGWLAVAKPLRDALRVQQRDALVAWLVGHAGFHDSNALFDTYLIDVEMSSCALTSRIKQAIGATQLFIQRALMDLEYTISIIPGQLMPLQLTSTQASQWSWMGSIGLWQANREVLLYPENWLDPTLRDDMTPFFQDLVNELNQTNVTADTAEVAFRNYLEKLAEVARLTVVATYTDPDTNIVHVVARTPTSSPKYYYRTYESTPNAVWTPWVPIPLDITGDSVMLVTWNRHIHLIWALFSPPSTPPNGKMQYPAQDGSNLLQNVPLKPLEITLAYSEFRDGSWSAKKVTPVSVDTSEYNLYDDMPWTRSSFHFTTRVEVTSADPGGQDLIVGLGLPFAGDTTTQEAFHFPGTGGDVYLDYVSLTQPTAPQDAVYSGQWLTRSVVGGPMYLNTATTPSLEVLGWTLQGTTVVLQRASDDLDADSGAFFLQDWVNCYFVQPQTTFIRWNFADSVHPSLLGQVRESIPYVVAADAPPQSTPTTAAAPAPAPRTASEYYVFPPASAGSGATTLANPYTAPRGTILGQLGSSARSAVSIGSSSSSVPIIDRFPIPLGQTTFYFQIFDHPYVREALGRLNRFGIDGLLSWRFQEQPQLQLDGPELQRLVYPNFAASYQPQSWVDSGLGLLYPRDDFDVRSFGAYSIYNWEVFFHAPLLVAQKLTQNQQFADAKRWLEYVFDPTDTNPQFGSPARYWKFIKFFDDAMGLGVPPNIVQLVVGSDEGSPGADEFSAQVQAYENDPFNPFAVARLRTAAFQKATVMAYVDNLIAWGDYLFSQNTLESINQATLMYVLASEILGPRPQQVDPPASPSDNESYDQLVAASQGGLGPLSDPLVPLENVLPSSIVNFPPVGPGGAPPQVLFFCVPGNDQLLARWDTVADRLNKIRHCMNIQGQVEQLPLFEPPLNPGLLVRAAAAGVDLSSILSDIGTPLPFYRFQIMAQKAAELVGEVRALGETLLSAIEKQDAEALALMRATQEAQVLQSALDAKQQALNEANDSYQALNQSQQIALARQGYYNGLIATGLLPSEQQQLDKMGAANQHQHAAQTWQIVAAQLAAGPGGSIGFAGAGGSPQGNISFSGQQLAAPFELQAGLETLQSNQNNYDANRAGISATQARRAQDWQFQAQMAGMDATQIGYQMQAAQDRINLATDEYATHQLQIQNAQTVTSFLQSKFTNTQLFTWMSGQISATYFQAYQLAYELAKRAEKAFHREIGDEASPAVNYIQFGYWDSLRQGLLAGDRLAYDLKRMEVAYVEQNRREFEITRHVSLLEFDPVALTKLKQTGVCYVYLPEQLFDSDFPGHYMRRIKAVGLTIPCEVGPYTGINCTLTLVRHCTRYNSSPSTYTPADFAKPDPSQFIYNLAALESVVTSTGQNDGGLFDTNLRDERYLPFEGAGVVSLWKIELPPDTNAFDTSTLTDVVVHLRYTARDGGEAMKSLARQALKLAYTAPPQAPQTLSPPVATRLFIASQDFSDEFYRFLNPDPSQTGQSFTLDLSDPRFPFHAPGQALTITQIRVFVVPTPAAGSASGLSATLTPPPPAPTPNQAMAFNAAMDLGNLVTATFSGLTGVTGTWTLSFAENQLGGYGTPVGGHTRIDPTKVADMGILCTFG